MALAIVALGIAATTTVSVFVYERAMRDQIATAETAADIAANQTDLLLRAVATAMEAARPGIMETGTPVEAAREALRALQIALPEVRSVLVLDPEGTVLADTAPGQPRIGANLSDRPEFRSAVDDGGRPLYLGPPADSASDGQERLTIGAPVRDSGGTLRAVVIATAGDAIPDLVGGQSLDLPPGQLSLLDGDLGLASPARSATGPGDRRADAPAATGGRGDASATVYYATMVESGDRLRILRPAGEAWQVAVLVEFPLRELRASAQAQTAIPAVIGLLLTAAAAGLGLLLARQNSRIRRSESLLGDISNNIPGVVCRYTRHPDGRREIPFISDGCIDLWELPARDLQTSIGTMAGMIEPGHSEAFQKSLAEAHRDCATWDFRWPIVTPSGRRKWLQGRGIPTRGQDGSVSWNAVILDVSELIEAQEELSSNQELVAHAARLDSLGKLTGGVAHEFNNLLSVILGNLEITLEESALDAEARQNIEEALRATRRGAEHTAELLRFGRKSRLSPRNMNANAALEGLRPMLRGALPESMELALDLAAKDGTIRVDLAQLESAILNLIINARDASEAGGSVVVRTRKVALAEAKPGCVGPAPIPPGTYVAIDVVDAGRGIDPQTLKRIFEPYFTTKPVGRGTGLGLSAVLGFVSQSGGYVDVDTQPGRGTTISLWFPTDKGATADTFCFEAAPHVVPDLEASGKHVLLVEDDRHVRRIVTRQLEHLGHGVTAVADAEAALARLRGADRVDLVLSDISLRGAMEGHQLARAVLEEFDGVPVILMSGFDGAEPGGPAAGPAPRFILKPFTTAELENAVRAALSPGVSAARGPSTGEGPRV